MEVVDMKVQRSWRHKFMVLEWHPDSVGITSTDGRRNKQVTHEIFRTSLGIKKHSIFCYKVHRTDQSNHTLCRLNVFSVLSLCVILMSNFLWSPGTHSSSSNERVEKNTGLSNLERHQEGNNRGWNFPCFSHLSPSLRADWELPQDNDYAFYVSLNIWSPCTLYMRWNITWSSLELRAYNLWTQHTTIQRKGGCSRRDRKSNLKGTKSSPSAAFMALSA